MRVLYDPRCAGYAAPGHPEAPFRVLNTAALLRGKHPGWFPPEGAAEAVPPADDATLLLAHTPAHLARLRRQEEGMFDPDTAALPGMDAHARHAAGAAVAVAGWALEGNRAFSLMRPPGHHATADQIMGFCYLNSVAVAALHARAVRGVGRVAVWDFDAHHGNGTEAILAGREGMFYASVHQFPCYPGTGGRSFDNVRNDPVAPNTPAEEHGRVLRANWEAVLDFGPHLILVSAGFDAYAGDPLTSLKLRPKEFAAMGEWMRAAPCPVGAILEGGYSQELPVLVNTFLEAWEGESPATAVRPARRFAAETPPPG